MNITWTGSFSYKQWRLLKSSTCVFHVDFWTPSKRLPVQESNVFGSRQSMYLRSTNLPAVNFSCQSKQLFASISPVILALYIVKDGNSNSFWDIRHVLHAAFCWRDPLCDPLSRGEWLRRQSKMIEMRPGAKGLEWRIVGVCFEGVPTSAASPLLIHVPFVFTSAGITISSIIFQSPPGLFDFPVLVHPYGAGWKPQMESSGPDCQ